MSTPTSPGVLEAVLAAYRERARELRREAFRQQAGGRPLTAVTTARKAEIVERALLAERVDPEPAER